MVEIEMPTKDYQKLLKAVSVQKGFRFTGNVVVGHGFFGNVAKSVLKSVAPTVIDFVGDKTGTRGITDALKPSANGLIDLGVNQISGGRLVKGSDAMKQRMAMLRGMRKGAGHKMKMDMDMIHRHKKWIQSYIYPRLGQRYSKSTHIPNSQRRI
jgi:hypothetical protein